METLCSIFCADISTITKHISIQLVTERPNHHQSRRYLHKPTAQSFYFDCTFIHVERRSLKPSLFFFNFLRFSNIVESHEETGVYNRHRWIPLQIPSTFTWYDDRQNTRIITRNTGAICGDPSDTAVHALQVSLTAPNPKGIWSFALWNKQTCCTCFLHLITLYWEAHISVISTIINSQRQLN